MTNHAISVARALGLLAAFVTTLATGGATGAMAQGYPASGAHDWSGGYFGAGLSYTQMSYATSGTAYAAPDASGFSASLTLGFNMQRGSMVYGGEMLGAFDSIAGNGTGCGLGAGFTCRASVRNYLAGRARIGYAFDNTLVFGTLGLVADLQDHEIRNGVNKLVGVDNQDHLGVVIGVGVEQAMSGNWSLRGDLEYYRLGARSYSLNFPGTTAINPSSVVARVSLVRRF